MSAPATQVKAAPNSKESEMMVLGSMLSSINSLNIAAEGLDESDFYFSEHRIIFEVLKEAYRSDKPADVHLVCEELKRQDKLSTVGGVAYVTTLVQYAGTSAFIEEYVGIVKSKSVLRDMIHASQVVEHKALSEPKDVDNLLDEAQNLFFRISQRTLKKEYIHIKEIFNGIRSDQQTPFLLDLQQRQENFQTRDPSDPGITGVSSHFIDLDKALNGLNKSNLIIMAARPAMGKTALALNVAQRVCFQGGVPVGIFSLEMSADQLIHRIISAESEVPAEKILRGSLDGGEYQRIVEAVHRMQQYDMLIDDQPGLKITDLRARARRMKETHDIGFIVIDYLQLLSGSGSTQAMENRQNEISEISRHLKTLARELNVPILCLSQLSRKVEERHGHRPMMSDLRESGSIEQDADQVLFLLRREYYDPNDKPGETEVIIGKNRHGSVGSVYLTYRKEMVRFENLTREMVDPSQVGDTY